MDLADLVRAAGAENGGPNPLLPLGTSRAHRGVAERATSSRGDPSRTEIALLRSPPCTMKEPHDRARPRPRFSTHPERRLPGRLGSDREANL